jgi:hypothetical protein
MPMFKSVLTDSKQGGSESLVKAVAGLGSLTLSDGVWADPQRCLSVQ